MNIQKILQKGLPYLVGLVGLLGCDNAESRARDYEVCIKDLENGEEITLYNPGIDDTFPAFSPTGQEVVYVTQPLNGRSEIYNRNLTLSNTTNLSDCLDEADIEPSWSYDGTKIIFVSYRDSNPETPDISNPEIYSVDNDGQNLERITLDSMTEYRDRSPKFSPDGLEIAFVSDRVNNEPSVYLMGNDGSNIRELVHDSIEPAWSPNGEKLSFRSYTLDNPNGDIGLINKDGSNLIILNTYGEMDFNASWSPDSERVVYVSHRNNAFNLFSVRKDGTDEIQLTDTLEYKKTPKYSPDGTKIVYSTNDSIFIVNSDGTNNNRVTDSYSSINPDWSPDSKKITYQSFR